MMFHNIIVKISEIVDKGNLLKTCLKFTYPTVLISAYFAVICAMGKMEIFDFLKPKTRIKHFR